MRLFTLFISYCSGSHYCGVYPSLEFLHDVIAEMARDEGFDKIPDLEKIRQSLDVSPDESFWHGFPDGTWIYAQETSKILVEAILDDYFVKFYSELLARITTDRASVTTHLPAGF